MSVCACECPHAHAAIKSTAIACARATALHARARPTHPTRRRRRPRRRLTLRAAASTDLLRMWGATAAMHATALHTTAASRSDTACARAKGRGSVSGMAVRVALRRQNTTLSIHHA